MQDEECPGSESTIVVNFSLTTFEYCCSKKLKLSILCEGLISLYHFYKIYLEKSFLWENKFTQKNSKLVFRKKFYVFELLVYL